MTPSQILFSEINKPCGDVTGNVDAGNSVSCGNVGGDVEGGGL